MNYESLIEFGEKSIFVVMGIASIIAIAVVIERAIVFFKSIKDSKIVFPDIISTVRNGELSELAKFQASHPENVYAKFAGFSAEHAKGGKESLSELLDGQIIGERVSLETRLSILNTLGNNAPFIGLLGTVFGVINAFFKLGTLGNTGAEVVMRAISTALLATAVGLAIAIPVVMANNYFTRKLKIVQSNLDILSKEFLANLARKK
ncbi:MotA/TolQ/ExbB proton channel family protein [Leptospira wolffii]|uniref:MotA/TolQ/ExbB proton channel family protein n=1 Tax=Leptospira wolffii TaxID=409998 RepID=A0A2M9ZBT1_9LEPT|nr:MotA/TolQ/ExbB proton channel family protein [Leptospira wolffii]EPG66119.1 transporter, MotA/TolQ/ExbB proton channel family protein [Leptospira wolffii serovar Khorat str. Khorat-H2]PJZ65890.1 MotA/TolQ/ExbB proton channel family protein [Leptospira wolffii]TGK59390.1 MotA/TolQ/ExbB proton channel family protein [Leptospira wolffii]TGK71227.1 MotA/TolQ/ExbB proton channel family protein [Leptospira wolffii]TGK77795.1 MotA/TolQ/ExbB proton channel family protein [Leptospira wolffii]